MRTQAQLENMGQTAREDYAKELGIDVPKGLSDVELTKRILAHEGEDHQEVDKPDAKKKTKK